jgi:hypothetical protein
MRRMARLSSYATFSRAMYRILSGRDSFLYCTLRTGSGVISKNIQIFSAQVLAPNLIFFYEEHSNSYNFEMK